MQLIEVKITTIILLLQKSILKFDIPKYLAIKLIQFII